MQIALTFRNNSWNVKRRLLHTRGSGMCYITRGSLRVDISNISDDGCLIFLNTDFADSADAHWKVMYRTLLVWLSGLLLLYPIEYTYAGLHLRGATRATCGTLRFQWRRTWRIIAALPYWIYVQLVCICAEPHVASNVRYIAFSMWAYAVVQNKGRAFWARPLLFM